MANNRIDPKKQFSKRLAKWTAFYWFIYMTWLSVIMLLKPEAAMYSFYMGIVCTVVMVVNVASYTTNSIQEKVLFAMLDKVQIELGTKSKTHTEGNDGDEESTVTEGGEGNG